MRPLAIVAVLLGLVYLFFRSMRSSAATSDFMPTYDAPAPSYSGGRLTASDIKQWWIARGGDPDKADIAAAVALAESSGDPYAFNGKDPHGGSFGLFQINGVHGDLATYDLGGNIDAAIQLSNNGQNWKPWGAFTNNSYSSYYDAILNGGL